jgi:hypothetical protein
MVTVNEQMATLRNLIVSAERGHVGASAILRSVIRLSSEKAPEMDVIRIAQFLYDLRAEAAQGHVQNN